MSEQLANGLIAGDDCCSHWPRTCAEVQAESCTTFRFCDFCLLGPPAIGQGITVDEAKERIEKTERDRGERLREAVIAAADLQGESDGC